MIGRTVSHYRILDKLGQGGMGIVYRAEDTDLHRTVALKFLPPHLVADDAECARLEHEARAAARLDHPNICTVYEIGQADDTRYIAMAYVEGVSLGERIEAGPLPLSVALRYAVQLGNALAHAHAREVVHRDIKPSNVVVTPEDHAILMDFGLARQSGATKLTKTGTTVGTVAYMSPEQTRGEDVDGRSDIWSLGAMLYQMVTGVSPFARGHEAATAYSIMNEAHQPLSARRSDVPLELERVVDKMLAKDPGQRYQGADDLVVDLKRLRDTPGSAPAGGGHAAPGSRSSLRLAVAGLAVVAAVVAAWMFLRPPANDAFTPSGAPPSLAVLPLENLSGDDGQRYFADGMTEALIARLAQIEGLKVISRTSVMQYRGTTRPIPEIGRELGVSSIIEGSVMLAGDEVRITAQLIDAKSDEHRWAESYTGQMKNVLRLQDEVARAIAGEIAAELVSGQAPSRPTVSPEAYDLYLRGRYAWNERTPESIRSAADYFERAIGIEPGYAMAHAALAQAYLTTAAWTFEDPTASYERARAEAKRGLEIDPEESAALASLAMVAYEHDWNWDESDRLFRRAVAANPGDAVAHQWYAEMLSNAARFPEAIEHIEIARELDPLSRIIGVSAAWVYTVSMEFEKSRAVQEEVLRLDPDFLPMYWYVAQLAVVEGRYDDAVEAYSRFIRLYPDRQHFDAQLVEAYREHGFKAYVLERIRLMRENADQFYVNPALMAGSYAAIGEVDSALAWVERGLDQRAYAAYVFRADPRYRSCYGDPRYDALCRRIGLEPPQPTEKP